ncbi:hypothetical protein TTHT_1579 [Thermotomaculum hydrothermale]|uniref:Uncharacterized protein n=1 Tax=Thermotomaculum hydrothermale TaxID=981385 RepID=A0A7R6PI83_9BACT|nr:hypothetical protein [Thermotomaculum hydrothermale]BBB33069.1 hypothetical protein TTHT_1579 [Thermotomaculum hydrothermale]
MELEKDYFFQRKYIENIEQLADLDGSVLIVSEYQGNDDVAMFFKEKGFEVTNISNQDFMSLEKGSYNVVVVENLFNKVKTDKMPEYLSKAASIMEDGGLLVTFFFSEKDCEKEDAEFVNNRDVETMFDELFKIQHIRTMMDGTRKVVAEKK